MRVVVIDRPDRANAIDLTGAGERVFSAGMDLKAVEAGQADEIDGVSGGEETGWEVNG